MNTRKHTLCAVVGAHRIEHKSGTGRYYDDDEPDVRTVKAALDRINSQCKEFRETESAAITAFGERLQDMEQRFAKRARTWEPTGSASVLDVHALMESDGFHRFKSGAQDRTGKLDLGISTKALLNFTEADTSSTGIPVQGNRTDGFFGFALRPLRLLDTLRVRPITSSAVDFIQLNFSGDAEVQDGEGQEKAEMEFEGSLVQARAATIAVHTTASAQVLADNQSLASELQRIMGHKVMDKAEQQLLVGSGTGQNIDGLYTQSTAITTYENEIPDRIGSAIKSMEATGYVPNVILMNPADWFAISILKDGEGRYLYGNPANPAQPSLWNRPVVTSPSIPAGYALVGDTNAVDVLEREAPSAYISRDHKDYRTRNLVLILIECRIGLALYDRLAFRKVNLSPAT